MATDTPQRAYRAACPGCGAPVEFRSAQSTHAVCAYCQSAVVRSGEALSRIGRVAELFSDFSPLRLQASGRFQGRAFTLVGRLQYHHAAGRWTEWQALLDGGGAAFLSEDNGAYVFTLPDSAARALPPPGRLRVGATTAINGKPFSIASNQQVSLLSAQGELAHLPALGTPFAMVELRSADGEVLAIDYGPALGGGAPQVTRGRAVRLDELALTGLKDDSVRAEQGGRQFSCPHCGAPLEQVLATSQSLTCSACHSLIDVSKGLGGELRSALQDAPVKPLIALGRIGQLQGASWQVVGFQRRTGHEPGSEDQPFDWDEYLLYHRTLGFCFLVDASDGWSLVKPLTGAPAFKPGAGSASHLGKRYRLLSSYKASTRYVEGEFYWQVQRGQTTFNRDFASGSSVLSQEAADGEITWSGGSRLDGGAVASAFRLQASQALFRRDGAGPLSSAPRMSLGMIAAGLLLIVLLLALLARCSRCDPALENCGASGGARTSGGAFGGFSGGGGHK